MRWSAVSRNFPALALACAVIVAPLIATGGAQQASSAVAAPKAGGSLTVLEGEGYSGYWGDGLDPATDPDAVANQDYMDAVYGQLFELGAGGKIIDDLATGYQFSGGGKTITIDLRHGVTFTDGSPFDAQVVVWNILRDLNPDSTCGCAPQWAITNAKGQIIPGSVKAVGPYTVQINLTSPDGGFIDQMFDTTPNWIASQKSFDKMGETAFARYPVGAGPFVVVSDIYSDQIVFKRNPHYWQTAGGVHLPYLDKLTFRTVSGDEAAYEALLAGDGQVYEDMTTTALINLAGQNLQVANSLGTSPYDLQLNTAVAPFNNPLARQAIYAATNFAPILHDLFGSRYPLTESFTGPGGICYEPVVPGYQGYDPALAKQLIAESGLNKVTIQLGTLDIATATQIMAALQAQWAKAGLKVSVTSYSLAGLIGAFEGGKWQSMLQTAGAYDPGSSVGVGFRFGSASPFSGVHDPKVDALLADGQDATSLAARCSVYHSLAAYIAKSYYGPFYFSYAPSNISVKGVGGPGLSTPLAAVAVTPAIPWEDVYL